METITYTKFGEQIIAILFKKNRCSWRIEATQVGIRFCNEYNSDYVCIYSNKQWACDYPEILPKYAVSAMYNLLKKYGEEGLNAICQNCK